MNRCDTTTAPAISHKNNLRDLFADFDQLFHVPQASAWNHQPFYSHEDQDNYIVRFELPGLKKDELKVNMASRILSIKGQKRVWNQGQENHVSIERSVQIPNDVAEDKVAAHYEDGILTVTLPKREESKPREIQIKIT